MIGMFEANLLVKNSTGSIVIAAKIKAVARRVGGVITIVSMPIEVWSNNTTTPGFTAGLKAVSNTSLQFFFTPATGDTTAYTGAFTEIKYTIN